MGRGAQRASWVEMLSLAEIAEEVTRSLDFLETDMADVPPRQRSIRAIFDAAWRRLVGEEQAVFRQLSVFRGGFTRQAAQAVTSASLRTLRALLHKLFVTVDAQGRYQIHELLRQYGGEKLAAAGGDASARTAHAHYFLELLHRSEAGLRGGRSLEALAEIEADFENIRSAWGWALTQRNEDAINRSLEALQIFLEINGRYPEAIALFEQAQHQLTPTDNRAPSAVWGRITARFSFMRLLSTGYPDSLDSVIERCQQTAQASGDRFEIAFCLFLRGTYLEIAIQDLEAAAVNLQQAVTIFREIGDDSFAARALITFGTIQYRRGLPEGRLLTEQALKLARKVDDLMAISVALNNLGEMALVAGEYGTAERYTQEALTLRLKQGVNISYPRAMSGLCMILRGQADEAEETLGNSLEEGKAQGHRTQLTYVSALLSLCATLRHDSVSARQLAAQALPNPTNDPLGGILGQWAMALALADADEWSDVLPHLRISIEYIHRLKSTAMGTWLLPLTAAVLAQANRPEQAVHHLALAHTHPLSPTAWLEMWPHLAPLRAQLEHTLGAEPFRLAWEAGKVRDLGEAMDDITSL